MNDLSTLLYVANLGCIEMHPLHSRCGWVETPDYLFFDLDPMGASFEDVLAVSLMCTRRCRRSSSRATRRPRARPAS